MTRREERALACIIARELCPVRAAEPYDFCLDVTAWRPSQLHRDIEFDCRPGDVKRARAQAAIDALGKGWGQAMSSEDQFRMRVESIVRNVHATLAGLP